MPIGVAGAALGRPCIGGFVAPARRLVANRSRLPQPFAQRWSAHRNPAPLDQRPAQRLQGTHWPLLDQRAQNLPVLCRVKTADEVKEYCAAFLQLYREEARYLERTAPWVERVGLNYIKSRLLEDAAGRRDLARRFLESQKFAQVDPWKARAEGLDADEYRPLAGVVEAVITPAKEAVA